MFRKLRNPIGAFLLCSMCLHFTLWGGVQILRSKPTAAPKPKVTFVILDQEEAEKLQQQTNKEKQQIVEQSKKRLNEEVPDKTKYLSRHSQKVEKETRAAKTGKFTNAALPGAPKAGSRKGGRQKKHKNKPVQSLQKKQLSPLVDFKTKFSPTPFRPVRPSEQPPGNPSQTDDHLKNTKVGAQTLLNTREFVYYSYYMRIKEKVRQHWEPSIRANVKRVVYQGRSIALANDRRTRVLITLDKNGALLQIKVVRQSGIMELDRAAIEAFKAAAPFPNPPKGIVEPDGIVRIRWDFVLEA